MFYSPLTFVFMIVFFISALFFLVFVQINVIALAFTKAGIPSQYIFIALLGVLFGSFVNIPLKKIPQEKLITKTWVDYFGFRYVVPARRR